MGGGNAGDRGDHARAPVVCNASPLIALERIGRLELLQDLFGQIFVPPAVVREIGAAHLQAWTIERRFVRPIDRRITAAKLDPGEREAIALGLELGASWVLLDDLPARRFAKRLGLPVIGTVGVLPMAKRLALLPEVRPSLEALMAVGFYVHPRLFQDILVEAGE